MKRNIKQDIAVAGAFLAMVAVSALALTGFFWWLTAQPQPLPHPEGNCSLWIADASPTFICVERNKAEVWKLRRDGSWQDIGPATNSNMGVNQG